MKSQKPANKSLTIIKVEKGKASSAKAKVLAKVKSAKFIKKDSCK